uniref:Uncharacterized protein n=1 Tax=Sphaerodactylus townsendi TaxID=933632 RepID=A0ACB8GC41_9SAUR
MVPGAGAVGLLAALASFVSPSAALLGAARGQFSAASQVAFAASMVEVLLVFRFCWVKYPHLGLRWDDNGTQKASFEKDRVYSTEDSVAIA